MRPDWTTHDPATEPGDPPEEDAEQRPRRERASERPRGRVPVTAGLVTVGLLAVAGLAAQAWVDEQTNAPVPVCDPAQTSSVVVAADPAIAEPLREATADIGLRPLDVAGCVDVSIVAQDPLQTAAEISTLPLEQLPDLWVPDSSTWFDRVRQGADGGVPLLPVGSLASSPLVVAADARTVTEQGWDAEAPTWEEVLTSGRPVALPDLAGSAEAVSALTALRQSVIAGAPEEQRAVEVQTALTTVANAIDAAAVTSVDAGFELAQEGGDQAPVIPTSRQQWFLRTAGDETPATVAIRPRDGSAVLDYPLFQVDRSAAGQDQRAVEAAIRVLEDDGLQSARAAGFSRPVDFSEAEASPEADASASPAPTTEGAESSEAGSEAGPPEPPLLPPPSAQQVDVLLDDLARLSRPSRALLVVDASVSMRAPTATGSGTRATLARDAVKTSLELFADSASVGLWFFAIGMGPGDQDYTEVVPVRRLTDDAGGVSQRDAVLAGTDTLVDRLSPDGTGLNDTVLAAVRHMREGYDPEATNVVVLVTDGRNDDANGIGRDQLIAALEAENDPERPVRVITVGLANDSEPEALRAIAQATGGTPYIAEGAEDFQTVLFDALRRRG